MFMQDKMKEDHGPSLIIIIDILSQPFPFVSITFRDTSNWRISSLVSCKDIPKLRLHLTTSNNPALLSSNLYQIPSQPRTIKLGNIWFGDKSGLGNTWICGWQVIAWAEYGRFLFDL